MTGFGVPVQRDLDFGTQVTKDLDALDWPEGVVIEDLSCSPYLALHRLRELQPRKLLLIGAVARGAGPPGSVHRRRPGSGPLVPDVVHPAMGDPIAGGASVDHTLAVLRRWGALPAETVLIEVEPADCGVGLGFSEALLPCFDSIVDLVREELDEGGLPLPAASAARPGAQRSALEELVALAEERRASRVEDALRRGSSGGDGERSEPEAPEDGLELAWASQPWGIGVESGSDWHDRLRLDHGRVGVVVGHVPGRGPAAVALMSDMRMAVRAYAAVDGHDPVRVVSCLDRVAMRTGRGSRTSVVYAAVDAATGGVEMCIAGPGSAIVVSPRAGASEVLLGRSAPIGVGGGKERRALATRLVPGSTLLAATEGLVLQRGRTPEEGTELLRAVAASGPAGLDALCRHILTKVVDRKRRDGDASLLGLRLASS